MIWRARLDANRYGPRFSKAHAFETAGRSTYDRSVCGGFYGGGDTFDINETPEVGFDACRRCEQWISDHPEVRP